MTVTTYSVEVDVSLNTFKYPVMIIAGVVAVVFAIVLILCVRRCTNKADTPKIVNDKLKMVKGVSSDSQFQPASDFDIYSGKGLAGKK